MPYTATLLVNRIVSMFRVAAARHGIQQVHGRAEAPHPHAAHAVLVKRDPDRGAERGSDQGRQQTLRNPLQHGVQKLEPSNATLRA
jgi:hypothetical protein